MKRHMLITALGLAMASFPVTMAGDADFNPLQGAPESNEEKFFKVDNGEARIDGEVIKLIVIKPEYLTASYKNDSEKSVSPKYIVRTYNRYGYLLGSDKVGGSIFGGSPRLESGDVGGEKIHIDLIDLEELFKHTGLELPNDFSVAAWVSLSESNTSVAGQDSDQPNADPKSDH